MLLKALEEAGKAPDPIAAVEMAMVRLCAAQGLPPPEDAARLLRDGPTRSAGAPATDAPSAQEGGHKLRAFEDVVALVESERQIDLQVAIERHMRVTRFATGEIVFAPAPDMPTDLPRRLMRILREATGEDWRVRADDLAPARPVESLAERRKRDEARALDELKRHPFVAEALKHFPGAEIAEVRAPVDESASADVVPLRKKDDE